MEKKILSEIRFWAILIVILNLALTVIVLVNDDKNHNETIDAIEAKDSVQKLYMEHLKECSMISKDDVAVDQRGYFYSKYFKEFRSGQKKQGSENP